MKKIKKTKRDVKERKILFKSYLIQHDITQKALAAELGVSMTSIIKSIERGAFEWGPFADWWKINILHINGIEAQSIKREAMI